MHWCEHPPLSMQHSLISATIVNKHTYLRAALHEHAMVTHCIQIYLAALQRNTRTYANIGVLFRCVHSICTVAAKASWVVNTATIWTSEVSKECAFIDICKKIEGDT